ncbi:MAG: histidinol dehydrogenase [Clostridiales bacterium]|jgi:histidinol dehydrogenase|nr:histidinol dehydrogenase [Clostridiales bacterium]
MIKLCAASNEEVKNLLSRKFEYGAQVEDVVNDILKAVKIDGEEAVFEYTKMFDGAYLSSDNFKVSQQEIDEAYEIVEREVVKYIEEAAANIADFHNKQKPVSWLEGDKEDNLLGQMYTPLERVGVYVPGGTAAYPSSVLMNAVPAKVAGVKEVVMVSPPSNNGKLNPYTLVAADVAGVDEIYKVGGAQAVAALAYGAGQLKPVDKITGPGNIYVTVAKKVVYGIVDIDMLAGPSEILIIADKSANPKYVAADMLSQAEHDELAAAILLTPEKDLAEAVVQELETQLANLSRRDIIKKSLRNHSAAIITEDLAEAIEIANNYAPEHLELLVEEPFEIMPDIKNAGAIFVGEWSPEPVGDYFAGPNHILPTGGTARFYSPVTVDTFMKKSSIIYYKKNNLLKNGEKIIKLAETEGLDAHANAVQVRLNNEFE